MAETVAAEALAFLLAQTAPAQAFLALSGLSPGDLARRLGDPALLAAAFDFLLQDEGLARNFAQAQGLSPQALQAARAALPGGDLPHWT